MRDGGGTVHGIQAWVAMPEHEEEGAPDFAHYAATDLPVFHDKGVEARLIAGDAYGMTNSVKTHSPMFYLHTIMQEGGAIGMPRGHKERAAYVTRGRIEYDGHAYDEGALLVFKDDGDAKIKALMPSIVMLLGGEPLGPRHIWWNFVSSRKERIEQAKADWQAGRFRLPIHDKEEFIPLPDEPRHDDTPHPEPEPMS
jgi:redox-sensitive bicupin YhaK (pirin superfamily)